MDIMIHAKFYFNRPMLTLIFAIWASEPPPGPGERLKRPGLIGLNVVTTAYIPHAVIRLLSGSQKSNRLLAIM